MASGGRYKRMPENEITSVEYVQIEGLVSIRLGLF